MKFRMGFVSNSSTSSFMMFAAAINKYDLSDYPKYVEAAKELAKKWNIKEDDEELSLKEIEEECGICEILDHALKNSELEYEAPYEWDEVFIGLSYHKILDNETGAQFKDRVRNGIKEVFGKELDCGLCKGEYSS